jgi:hypothetical protein
MSWNVWQSSAAPIVLSETYCLISTAVSLFGIKQYECNVSLPLLNCYYIRYYSGVRFYNRMEVLIAPMADSIVDGDRMYETVLNGAFERCLPLTES